MPVQRGTDDGSRWRDAIDAAHRQELTQALQEALDIIDSYDIGPGPDIWHLRLRPIYTICTPLVAELFGEPLWRDRPENQVQVQRGQGRTRSRYSRNE